LTKEEEDVNCIMRGFILFILHHVACCYGDQIREDVMDGVCSMHEESIQNLCPKS